MYLIEVKNKNFGYACLYQLTHISGFSFVLYFFGLSLSVNHFLCKSCVHACICVIFENSSADFSEDKNNFFEVHNIYIYMPLLVYIS